MPIALFSAEIMCAGEGTFLGKADATFKILKLGFVSFYKNKAEWNREEWID